MKLNLGCGKDYKEGWVNLDKSKRVKTDVYHDLENGLPFGDNKFDEVLCSHILEHIKNFYKLMDEISRVLKVGGELYIVVPHYSCYTAYYEDHVRFFRYNSFEDFTGQADVQELFEPTFEMVERKFMYSKYLKYIQSMANIKPKIFERFFSNIFPPNEIKFKLKVVK